MSRVWRADDIRSHRPGKDHRCELQVIADAMTAVGTTQGQVQAIREVVNSHSNLQEMDPTENAKKGERTRDVLDGASNGGRRDENAIGRNLAGIEDMLRNEKMTHHTRRVLNKAKEELRDQ